ncbi:MAG TPA: F0F1 ATP synthase subunit delta [Candidatus Methylomirabilis sp.]|nr:F0F1 ATP synthase subunit delta [Candidatus Methylomirabilis sp.]
MLHLRWSTVAFQVLNFFILLAVLGRFLYRPLLEAMQRREDAVAAVVRDAGERARRADAERTRLAEAARAAREESEALLARARAEAGRATEEARALAREEATRLIEEAGRRIADEEGAARRRLSREARISAVKIAGNLLGKVAGRPFHEALVARLLDGGLELDGAQADLLRAAVDHAGRRVVVESAYPVPAETVTRLAEAIGSLIGVGGESVRIAVRVDPSLTAGLRLAVETGGIDLSLRRVLADLERDADRGDA